MAQKFIKGQINIIGIVLASAGMAMTAFGFYTASNVRTDNRIGEIKTEQSAEKERIAKLEEAITTIKQDNAIIKSDIKTILQKLTK